MNIATGPETAVQVVISNMLKHVVKSYNYGIQDDETLQTDIEVSDLKVGTYFITIPSNEGVTTRKMVINK